MLSTVVVLPSMRAIRTFPFGRATMKEQPGREVQQESQDPSIWTTGQELFNTDGSGSHYWRRNGVLMGDGWKVI